MKQKIAIIKLGAIGDVLRTTPILRVLKGEITWITDSDSVRLLEGNPYIKEIVPFCEFNRIANKNFDWIINLEEDWRARALENMIASPKKTGWNPIWCLMSIDDDVKKANKETYQWHMFKSIGKKFNGQEYVLSIKPKKVKRPIIGIEMRSGDRWPTKRWHKFPELIGLLKKKGLQVKIFDFREDLKDFSKDINDCKIVVSGDTLSMHLGLALEKNVIAIFGPTSSNEIYGYGRMTKIISPLKCVCCYKRNCEKKPNCMDAIKLKEVFKAIEKNLG